MGKNTGPTVAEQIREAKILKTVSAVVDDKYKVSLPTVPENTPDFPMDLTSLGAEDVGRLLSAYDAEIAYIRYLLANVEVKIMEGRHILGVFKKRLFLGIRGQSDLGSTVHDANAWVDINEDVLKAEAQQMEAEGEQKLLEARLDLFTKYSASVSREISRRKMEYDNPGGKTGGSSPVTTDQKARIERIKGKELSPKGKR